MHAALGDKHEALRHARRAVELLPIARDTFNGPLIATCLAVAYPRLAEVDLAIAELETLVGIPNGPTPGTLLVEPEWDSLRDQPRFQKLCERM